MGRPATDRLKFNPPLGMLPALQYLLPQQLEIDAQYQRSLDSEQSQQLVRAIAQHWNWDLCQPLVVVRLHVLGDFWSVEYVQFWDAMLRALPMLAVFGFTAHQRASAIGQALVAMAETHGWLRAAIRFSSDPEARRAARVLGPGETDANINNGDAVMCPAQTGGTDCCATCALCWHSDRSIAFQRH